MMDPNHYLKRWCWICGATERGRFSSPRFYCGLHERDEVDLHQAMPADRRSRSKEDKALERIYAKRWQGREALR